jgi:dihydropteroate synthase
LEDDAEMAGLCARAQAAVILMHKKGTPESMQVAPSYADPVTEVGDYLRARAQAAQAAGIDPGAIALDPGIGFGKRLEDNLALLAGLDVLVASGYPVLVGLSRKSFLGALTGRAEAERLGASLAAMVCAYAAGARIFRVHDVRASADALAVASAISGAAPGSDAGEGSRGVA